MTPGMLPPARYEFLLSRPGADGTPGVPAPLGTAESSNAPHNPQKEALKRKVADRLMAHNPHLQVYQFPYEKIAQFEKISLEETRRKYRHLELNGPEGGNGIQMLLWDDEASLTLPFWHELSKAAEAFRELWSYLEIVCREAGYAVYDPQLQKTLDLAVGCEDVLSCYQSTARRIRESLPVNGAERQGLGARGADAGGSQFPLIQQVAGSEGTGTLWVAVLETGAVCGYARLVIVRGFPGRPPSIPVAYLDSWYVAPEFRGSGIGRQLLDSAEQWAAAHGFRDLASNVPLENEQAINAHLACGFAEGGRAAQFTKPLGEPLSLPKRAGLAVLPTPTCEEALGLAGHPTMDPTLPAPDAASARL